MARDLDRAVRLIEVFLVHYDDDEGLDEAVETIVASTDVEALQAVTALMHSYPSPQYLESFWAAVADEDKPTDFRVESLKCITGVLLNAEEELSAVEVGLQSMLDEAFLTQEEFDGHLNRLMRAYRTAEYPVDVRRFALEMAANLSRSDEVVSAGRAAFASDDPIWIGSGLMVISMTDPRGSRELIYKSLDHEDQHVRLEAIRCLGCLERSRDIDTLGKVVIRRNGLERAAALATLVDIPDPDAGQTLYDCTEILEGQAHEEAEAAYEEWLEQWSGIEDVSILGFDEDLDDEDLDDEDLDDDDLDDDFDFE